MPKRVVIRSLVVLAGTACAPVVAGDALPDEPRATTSELFVAPLVPRVATPLRERESRERSAPPPLDLGSRTIRKAIAASRDPLDDVRSSTTTSFGAGAARATRVDRAFRQAEIPSCAKADALRFEPTTIGPVSLGGYLLLPLWIHAMATGRCK